MAPGQKPRDQKIAETLQAIKDCGWRSTNQFIEAFYASSGASTLSQSLRYQPDSTYGPERIMTAWMANVPSGDAKHHLNLSITRKAAEIMVQESTKAYHNNGLRLSTSGLFSMAWCAEWARYMVWGHWGVQWNQRSSIWRRRPVRGIFNAHEDRILSYSL